MTKSALRTLKTQSSTIVLVALILLSALIAGNALGQSTEPAEPENSRSREAPMTQTRMAEIVKNLVDESQGSGNFENDLWHDLLKWRTELWSATTARRID